MTINQIVSQIRLLGHDKLSPIQDIYVFINNAIKDIDSAGDFNWQLYHESIYVPKGETAINFSKTPVKRIISAKIGGVCVENSKYTITLQGDNVSFEQPVDRDLTLDVKYTYYHPYFDGTEVNKIIPEPCDDLYVLGGVFYLMIRNEDPSAGVYQQLFNKRINECLSQDLWKVSCDFINNEIGGV